MRLNALAIMPIDEIWVGKGVGSSAETITRYDFAMELPRVFTRHEVMHDKVAVLRKMC
jgi:hypothetical protein